MTCRMLIEALSPPTRRDASRCNRWRELRLSPQQSTAPHTMRSAFNPTERSNYGTKIPREVPSHITKPGITVTKATITVNRS
jgi:hypothetical protein